jgi:hypothetical protein
MKSYIEAMQSFSFDQMHCASKQLACWGDFKKLTDIYMSKSMGHGGVMTDSFRFKH